ncbi:DUF3035 domain-containing protein [uncultured Gammaproteobacteria bacterium]
MTKPGRRLGCGAGLAAVAAALIVAGCETQVFDDRVLEVGPSYQYFFGDPPPSTEAEASPVRRMSGRDSDYPKLNTVPHRPPPPPTEAERKARIARLSGDRKSGELSSNLLREDSPESPPAKARPPAGPATALPEPLKAPPRPDFR